MVYIEMSKDEKSKGKAAVDLLGSQIGKSGGAWVTQALLLITGSLAASLPVIFVTFMGVIVSWLASVRKLGLQLKDYEDEKVARFTNEADAGANGNGNHEVGKVAGTVVT